MKHRAKGTRKSVESKTGLSRTSKPYREPYQRYYYSYQIEKISGTGGMIFRIKRELHATGLVLPVPKNGLYKKQVKLQKKNIGSNRSHSSDKGE